jgi:hypothetical protein
MYNADTRQDGRGWMWIGCALRNTLSSALVYIKGAIRAIDRVEHTYYSCDVDGCVVVCTRV